MHYTYFGNLSVIPFKFLHRPVSLSIMFWTLKCRLKVANISRYVQNNIKKEDYSQNLGLNLHCLLNNLTDQKIISIHSYIQLL